MKYFAVQIMTGKEDSFIELFGKTSHSTTLHVIKKKIQSKRKGKSVTLINPIFPGYLFFQSEDERPPVSLISALKRTTSFVRVLPATDAIKPLSDRDAEIVRRLLSFGKEIGTSLVTFDENNRIRVIRGPLTGLEGMIVKVDKRKRRAKVMLEMNDSPLSFDLGFDVMETDRGKTAV